MRATRLLLAALLATSALAAPAPAPGAVPASRGEQFLPIAHGECMARAQRAFTAEGWGGIGPGGNFVFATKGIHSAYITCNAAPGNQMVVNIFVASEHGDGTVPGAERVKLQNQMNLASTTPIGGTPPPIILPPIGGTPPPIVLPPIGGTPPPIILPPTGGTPPPIILPPPIGAARATLLGQTGEDYVGRGNQTTASGVRDVHIRVDGLTAAPVKYTVIGQGSDRWEAPFNGNNWIIAVRVSGGTADLFLEPSQSASYQVVLTYADGRTEQIQAAGTGAPLPGTARATLLGQTGEDYVGRGNQTTASGVRDVHIRVDGLTAAPVKYTVIGQGADRWEAPFNGNNWIIAVRVSGGTADLFLEPSQSASYQVVLTYTDGRTEQIQVAGTGAPLPSTARATLLGQTGEDYVGRGNQTTASGVRDVHIRVDGLTAAPVKYTVIGQGSDRWEAPFNGNNWIIAVRVSGGTADLFLEPNQSASYQVVLTYADGRAEQIQAAGTGAPLPSTARATLLGQTGEDYVGRGNQTTASGVRDVHIRVDGLTAAPVKYTVIGQGSDRWEAPFNGNNWIIAVRISGGTADLFLEPNQSASYQVVLTYTDGRTEQIQVAGTGAPLPSTARATLLGQTGEDYVGRGNQTTASGVRDVHIRVDGLTAAPVKYTVIGQGSDRWEAPFNGNNWIIAVRVSGGTADLFLEPNQSASYQVVLTYADGRAEQIQAAGTGAPLPSTARATLLGQTGEDYVGRGNQTTASGVRDVHIRVDGLTAAPVKYTVIGQGSDRWEAPFNGNNWIIAVRVSGGTADLFLEPSQSASYQVVLTYADGRTEQFQVAGSAR